MHPCMASNHLILYRFNRIRYDSLKFDVQLSYGNRTLCVRISTVFAFGFLQQLKFNFALLLRSFARCVVEVYQYRESLGAHYNLTALETSRTIAVV